MDKGLELKINKAIAESLPAQLGEELRRQLELIPHLQNLVRILGEQRDDLNISLEGSEQKCKL